MSLYPEDIEMLWYELKDTIKEEIQSIREEQYPISINEDEVRGAIVALHVVLEYMQTLEERGAIYHAL